MNIQKFKRGLLTTSIVAYALAILLFFVNPLLIPGVYYSGLEGFCSSLILGFGSFNIYDVKVLIALTVICVDLISFVISFVYLIVVSKKRSKFIFGWLISFVLSLVAIVIVSAYFICPVTFNFEVVNGLLNGILATKQPLSCILAILVMVFAYLGLVLSSTYVVFIIAEESGLFSGMVKIVETKGKKVIREKVVEIKEVPVTVVKTVKPEPQKSVFDYNPDDLPRILDPEFVSERKVEAKEAKEGLLAIKEVEEELPDLPLFHLFDKKNSKVVEEKNDETPVEEVKAEEETIEDLINELPLFKKVKPAKIKPKTINVKDKKLASDIEAAELESDKTDENDKNQNVEKIVVKQEETNVKKVVVPKLENVDSEQGDDEGYDRITFEERLAKSDPELLKNYEEIKKEILSYGIKNRVSRSGDTFRLHTKTYIKLTVAGKGLKLYFALDPKKYANSTFPIGDASNKKLYKDIPLVFKVKSELSVRRAKQLIEECLAVDGIKKSNI